MFKALLSALVIAVAVPATAGELSVQLPGREGLVLSLPSGWRGQVDQSGAGMPPTITITSNEPSAFQILVTPLWPVGSAKAPTAADVRNLVQGATEQVRSRAVERDLPLTELSAPGKLGYYFSATDREVEPNGYKYLTQGAVGFGELRVTFTILMNRRPQETAAKALEVVRTMRRTPAKSAT